MGRLIDMTEGEAEYLKYRFKQYLGSVSRAIQNKRLEEQEMGMPIDEIKQALHKADLALRPWCVFANPTDAKAIREALPRIEEEVVIQETDAIESGKAIAIEREKLEAWTYGNAD